MNNEEKIQLSVISAILIIINFNLDIASGLGRESTPRPGGDSMGVTAQTDLFCKTLSSTSSTECRNIMKAYFAKVKEPENNIDEYAKFCVGRQITPYVCATMMVYFVKFDWDMKTLTDFLTNIDTDYYASKLERYKHLRVYRDEWYEYEFGKFKLTNCLDQFDPDFDEDDIDKDIDVLKLYKTWWATNDETKTSKCGCADVLGIHYLWSARKSTSGKKLDDFFNEFCLNDAITYNFKTYDQYVIIVGKYPKATLEQIKEEISKATQ